MPTGILTAAATGAATAGASGLMSGLFGGGGEPSTSGFAPTGINAGGLSSTIDGQGRIQIGADGARTAAVGNIASTFGKQADALATLLPRVAPGISDLRSARLGQVENARLNAVGNLRDNLARRRVLGSSFGQDAITRAEAEFSQQKQAAEAESFLQEMEMTTNLMQQEFTARRGQFQTGLDEMNFEANLAAGLAGKATDALAKNAQIDAMLTAQSQAGAGKFFGQLAQPFGAAVGKGVSGLFGGGTNAGNIGGTGGGLGGLF